MQCNFFFLCFTVQIMTRIIVYIYTFDRHLSIAMHIVFKVMFQVPFKFILLQNNMQCYTQILSYFLTFYTCVVSIDCLVGVFIVTVCFHSTSNSFVSKNQGNNFSNDSFKAYSVCSMCLDC